MPEIKRFSPAALRRLRTMRALALADVANAVGVGRTTVWNWEAGKAVPDADQIAALAVFFRRRIDAFYEEVA